MLTIDVKVTQRLKVSRLRQKYSNHIRSKNKCGSNAGWFKAWQTRGCNGKLGWNAWRTCRYSCCLSIIWKPNAFACMASWPVRLLATISSLIQELCRHLHLHHHIGTLKIQQNKLCYFWWEHELLVDLCRCVKAIPFDYFDWYQIAFYSLKVLQCIIKMPEKKICPS